MKNPEKIAFVVRFLWKWAKFIGEKYIWQELFEKFFKLKLYTLMKK